MGAMRHELLPRRPSFSNVVLHVRISYFNVFVIVLVFTFVVKVITLAILLMPISKLLFQVSNRTPVVYVTLVILRNPCYYDIRIASPLNVLLKM